MNAAYYGVPQSRKRLIIVGRKGERDGFLEVALRKAASPDPMPLRSLFGDQIGNHVYNHPRAPDRRGVWSVDEPNPTIRNARRPQPTAYEPHRNDSNFDAVYFRPFHDARGVYSLDEPGPSIVRTSRERPRESYLSRPHAGDPLPADRATILTQADISRIQGFPADWDWSGFLVRDADQMIANAVPSPMAEKIGLEILRRAQGQTAPEVPGNFGQWLSRERGMIPQRVANTKWRVKKAWTFLEGRDLACPGTELHELELAMKRDCVADRLRSEVRIALKLFREWQSFRQSERERRRAPPPHLRN
ncbi:hypothetical protein FHS67_005030 [Aminobacter aminovorans]|uniref:DNA (cytosine-5-)-methyltransferase n=1 Tax=Aminobacter aminovorans TaxID=83263 RepID=A0AAC9FEU2_AMIAI|nr:hypothetical protein AA2016_6592 [Aminobacter aminovorans]MBB3708690.1 hypothetical protein [Aminobacter aminovorans]